MSVYEEGELLTKEQVFDTNVDNRWKYLPTGWHYDEEGKCCRIHETMYLYSDEAFWGFGEKFTDLNKRGQQSPTASMTAVPLHDFYYLS